MTRSWVAIVIGAGLFLFGMIDLPRFLAKGNMILGAQVGVLLFGGAVLMAVGARQRPKKRLGPSGR